MTLREAIAKAISEDDGTHWDESTDSTKQEYLENADAVLQCLVEYLYLGRRP